MYRHLSPVGCNLYNVCIITFSSSKMCGFSCTLNILFPFSYFQFFPWDDWSWSNFAVFDEVTSYFQYSCWDILMLLWIVNEELARNWAIARGTPYTWHYLLSFLMPKSSLDLWGREVHFFLAVSCILCCFCRCIIHGYLSLNFFSMAEAWYQVVNRSLFLVCVQIPLNLNLSCLAFACRTRKLQFGNGRKKMILVNLGEFIIRTRIS